LLINVALDIINVTPFFVGQFKTVNPPSGPGLMQHTTILWRKISLWFH